MTFSSKWFVVLILATTLYAQTVPKPRARKAPAKPAVPAVTAADVQALKDALAVQQQQIQQLQQALMQRDQAVQVAQQQAQQAQAAATDAQQKAGAVAASAGADEASVTKLNSDLTDVKTTIQNQLVTGQDEQKRVSALESAFGRFRLVGDVRIRGESFFQEGVADRNRARVRVRLGFDGKLKEDFLGGIALATGSLADPTTTNETLTNNFDRKTIGLDRGWITYNPVAHKWLSLTGGKFAYQWQRSSVTGDPDLNPEGFNEKVSFDLHHVPVVQNMTVQGMQLLYNEASGTGGLYHGHDSFAVGGQVSAKLAYKIWTAMPSFLLQNWRYPDAILNSSAFAVQATTAGINGNPTTTPTVSNVGPIPVPGEGPGCSNPSVKTVTGFPAVPINAPSANGCVAAANGMTNATWVDLTNPAAPKWHFLSNFLYADFILNNTIKTPSARFPVNLLLEYENNLNASEHPFTASGRSGCVSDGGTPPVITCTTSQPAVNTSLGKQSHAYLVDFSVGQQRNKGDIQIGYAWLRQEQDAVIATFTESDQRAPTNILQHRIYALWKVRANTVASFTWWHGRTLNSNLLNASLAAGVTAGQVEPWLNRLQFDWIYTF
jgi:multidrug efflux pump subunit AcrA (membrane-fusion protein)